MATISKKDEKPQHREERQGAWARARQARADEAWRQEEYRDCYRIIARQLSKTYRALIGFMVPLVAINLGLFAAISLKPIAVYGVTDSGQVIAATPYVSSQPFRVSAQEHDRRFLE